MESFVHSIPNSRPASTLAQSTIEISTDQRSKSRTRYSSLKTQSYTTHLVHRALESTINRSDLEIIKIIEQARPVSLRDYDQIPMRSLDLLRQVHLIAPQLENKAIAFVGDHDSTSLLIGLLSSVEKIAQPSKMLLLDFDERLLAIATKLAQKYGFDSMFDTCLYNVFDPLPRHLIGQFDWFYTNPPYGRYNGGESVRLFINRGCELVQTDEGNGCVILPHDSNRQWTQEAMLATQQFLCSHNWVVNEKLNQFHHYHLDDDKELSSCMLLTRYENSSNSAPKKMPYSGRRVSPEEIPNFYGRSDFPPYPHYIRKDGSHDFRYLEGDIYGTQW